MSGKAMKFAYQPVGLLLGAGAGAVSGLIFKQVRKTTGQWPG